MEAWANIHDCQSSCKDFSELFVCAWPLLTNLHNSHWHCACFVCVFVFFYMCAFYMSLAMMAGNAVRAMTEVAKFSASLN